MKDAIIKQVLRDNPGSESKPKVRLLVSLLFLLACTSRDA
jgi:hypothetical protein